MKGMGKGRDDQEENEGETERNICRRGKYKRK